MKRWFLVSVILFLLGCVVGCGKPQEQYDAVLAERDQAQQELQSVRAELDKTKAELTTVRANLQQTKAELDETKTSLTTAVAALDKMRKEARSSDSDWEITKAELATARAELEKARERIDAVSSAWSSLKPKVEVLSVIVETIETTGIKLLGANGPYMTDQEYTTRRADQRDRIAVALESIGNKELSETLLLGKEIRVPAERIPSAWDTGPFGSKLVSMDPRHYDLWRRAAGIIIDLTNPDLESLSKQVSP